MQFTYHQDSGLTNLTIDGDLHKYLFKIRRHKQDNNLFFRNLKDDNIYEYEIIDTNRRETKLGLLSRKELILKQSKSLHLGWCIIDIKSVEKVLASLNELGVKKISFIHCEYSQKQFKPNFDKLNKILINSSQQCGRSNLMILEDYNDLDSFIKDYPDTFVFNFSTQQIKTKKDEIQTILIGCEGGFSISELKRFNQNKIVGINSNLILRSETAVISVASTILL